MGKRKPRFCIDCGKKIARWNAKRCRSCAHKGSLGNNYKTGLFSDHKKHCIDCGKEISYKAKRCRSCAGKGELSNVLKENYLSCQDGGTLVDHFCKDCGKKKICYGTWRNGNGRCQSCASKQRVRDGTCAFAKGGKEHSTYIHGRGYEPYSLQFNSHLKEKIRKRDNYHCHGENCTMTEEEHLLTYKRVLEIHHIDYDKKNCEESNLITLCKQCNMRANYNRQYWQDYFTETYAI